MKPALPAKYQTARYAIALLLTLLVAAGLRLYRLPELPLGLHYDEAANGILAGEIAHGAKTPVFISSYTGKEALFFYWAALWMKLLGMTPLALRLSAALAGLATVAATVWAVRELLYGQHDAKWVALLTGAFLATSFWHLILSRYGFRAVTQPLVQALTVATLWRGLRLSEERDALRGHSIGLPNLLGARRIGMRGRIRMRGRIGMREREEPEQVRGSNVSSTRTPKGLGKGGLPWLILAGLFCGLTAYTYLAARAFPVPLAAALLAALVADRDRRRARLGQLVIFAAVAALALAPLAHYWLAHPGSFMTRTQQVAAASWTEAWAGVRACLGMFFLRGDPYIRFNIPHRPLFGPVTAILFLLGLATTAWQFGRSLPNASRSPCHRKRSDATTSAATSPRHLATLSSCLLASRVFLLTYLPIMLLPSALAVGDITPSNLRTAGLLPFIYVFPALGLQAILNAVRYLLVSKLSSTPRDLLHPASCILLLVLSGLTTTSVYFNRWATSAELYYAADGDLADVAAYLNQADLTATTPYVASIHYRHPTLAFLVEDYRAIRWLTGGKTIVLPAEGDALLAFPRSASGDLTWVQSILPDNSLATAPPGPDGASAFHVYRVGLKPDGSTVSEATPAKVLAPTHPLTVNLAHVVYLLGYDVIGRPRSNERAEVAIWWRVLNPPPANVGDYGPVARLIDPWGFVWGETQPFHYPSEQWAPGEWIVDHISIPVAAGAPPGDYAVRISLYSASADSLLPTLDDVGRYTGTTVQLPLRLTRAAPPPGPGKLPVRNRLDAHANGLTLLGFNLDTSSARPGERLYLTLFWRADQFPLPDTDVTLTLDGATLYAGAPVHDTYPTSDWVAGEIVVDRYDPRLPRDTPPGDHPLQLRLNAPSTWDGTSTSGQASSTWDGTSTSGYDLTLDLGTVTVQAINRVFDVPPISHPLTVTLGSQVQLLGYDLPTETVTPGDTLILTLYWRALTEMDENYTVFTHLLAPDGSTTGQRDSHPVNGTYPTSLWLIGEVVTDVYEIPTRADAAPGTHRLEVGMYVAETGDRLPTGTPDDAVTLQAVTLTVP